MIIIHDLTERDVFPLQGRLRDEFWALHIRHVDNYHVRRYTVVAELLAVRSDRPRVLFVYLDMLLVRGSNNPTPEFKIGLWQWYLNSWRRLLCAYRTICLLS